MQIARMAARFALACTLFTASAFGQMVGGAGPAVGSRGGNRAGERGSGAVDFTFFAGASGTYTDQFLPVRTDEQGEVPRLSTFGWQGTAGVYGSRHWRRSTFGVEATTGYAKYGESVASSGAEHLLSLDYSTNLTARWQIVTRTTAGTSTRAFGGFVQPQSVATDYISLPLNEIFNNRIYFVQTMGYAGYRKSSRSTIVLGGGGFGTRRASRVLVNVNGYLANAQYTYRFSRNLNLGAMYNFMHFDFPRAFGASDMHGGAMVLERSIGRNISAVLRAGIYRMETLGSEVFTLNPEVAAILGRTTGSRVLYRIDYLPQIEAGIYYRRRTTSYRAGYRRGASPGNGVYLTSQMDSADAGVSYTGVRRVSFSANLNYSRMESLFSTVEAYKTFSGGGGMSIALGRGFNFTADMQMRRITAGEALRGSWGKFASIGIFYSSSETPLSIW